MRRERGGCAIRPGVEGLEGRAMLSGMSGMSGAAGWAVAARRPGPPAAMIASAESRQGPRGSMGMQMQRAETYQVSLAPENGSSVTGVATMVRRGNMLRITLQVRGLEPGRVYASHIHGFAGQPQDMPSMTPPPEAADDVPGPNGLGPGIISELEGTPYVGPIMKTVSRGFRANANGVARVQATVDLTHDSYSAPILPLEIRMLEVHGKTIDGVFQPTVPVAGGMPMLTAGSPNMAMGPRR